MQIQHRPYPHRSHATWYGDHERIIQSGLHGFRWFILQNAYPPALLMNTLGSAWFFYFLWHRSWVSGLFVWLFFGFVSSLTTHGLDRKKIAQGHLGSFLMVVSHPTNFFFQFAGVLIFGYGIWEHHPFYVMSGLSTVMLGFLSGWRDYYEK